MGAVRSAFELSHPVAFGRLQRIVTAEAAIALLTAATFGRANFALFPSLFGNVARREAVAVGEGRLLVGNQVLG